MKIVINGCDWRNDPFTSTIITAGKTDKWDLLWRGLPLRLSTYFTPIRL